MAERIGKVIHYDLVTEINHGILVSSLASAVGEELGLPKEQCHELAVAGVLHDIGKLRARRQSLGRLPKCPCPV